MASRVRGVLERLLARRREAAPADAVPDAELLRRFAAGVDAAAFELLVWRHGAMVLGVCRRAVRDEQLAEDAFQAVFLVLARKAGAVRGGNLAGWLFRVARRTAARANRNRPPEVELRDRPATSSPCPVEDRELAALLDAEVARLPARLRRPVVLCYLGGRTTEDAARELGCPRGTILSRLAAARKRLADRLTRRGVTLPATLALPVVGAGNRLVTAAGVAAAAFRLGTHTVSTATILASGVCTAMTRFTVLSVLGGIVLATGLATSIGYVTAGGTTPTGTPIPVAAADPARPKAAEPRADKPADRAEKLGRQSAELAKRVEQLQARTEREAPAPANTVDIAVLQSALFALDREVLAVEQQVEAWRGGWLGRRRSWMSPGSGRSPKTKSITSSTTTGTYSA